MQLKITLPPELHEHLQASAKKYGLTMTSYVKNLIIQDVKENARSDNIKMIDKSIKKNHSWKDYDLLDG